MSRMRIPMVTGRIRVDRLAGAPGQALRAAYTQVGRVLMAADELRSRVQEELASRDCAASPAEAKMTSAAALPVPNYDELSLPSLRARLRVLDADQLRALAQYERSHAGRADIVGMFERRIAKLAAQ